MSEIYDLVVIGAGPGGYTAAIRAAQNGLRTAVIEQDLVGGTCLNRGCIPTKALLHAAGLYREIKNSEELGILTEGVTWDPVKLDARKNVVTGKLRDGVQALLKANGITVVDGRATIMSRDRIRVTSKEGEHEISGAKLLIAAGSVPLVPDIPGFSYPNVLTSDHFLEKFPEHISDVMIVGGGVIGVEFASILNGLDIGVTIIEAADRLLPALDRELSQNLKMIFKKRGIAIHTSARVERVEKGGKLTLHVQTKEGPKELAADLILSAIGRKAQTKDLFGPDFCPLLERGALVTDHNFMTSEEGVFAIGDVVSGSIQLAHAASAQGLYVADHICRVENRTRLDIVPSCIYTEPEIACVGLTADQAKEKGIAVLTGKYATLSHGKSMITGQERGFVKLVFNDETKALIGAQLMCARATDLISELTEAVIHGLTAEQLAAVIRPHPTFTEAVTEAAEQALGKSIHSMPVRKKKS